MDSAGDKLFYARLGDLLDRASKCGCAAYSRFLDERQSVLAEQYCRGNAGELLYTLWGGFPDARRKMLAVYPEYCSEAVMEEFPMTCVTFTFRREDKLTHRDILGTLMGQRLARETVGDIVTDEGIAQVFVTETAAKAILTSVSKVGRVGVKVSDGKAFCLETEQEFRVVSGTVASMRLDCVVGLACGMSRAKASALIRSERVDVDHLTVTSVSHELSEGDILSVRGYGRFILSGINGLSKKDRIHIELRKYI